MDSVNKGFDDRKIVADFVASIKRVTVVSLETASVDNSELTSFVGGLQFFADPDLSMSRREQILNATLANNQYASLLILHRPISSCKDNK